MRKKLTAILLALFCALGMVMPQVAYADGQKVVTLGADLDEAQRNAILRYFGAAGQNNIRIIYVTNQDERNHLGSFIPLEQIGTRTISCAMVNPTMSGGIQVKTANMNYVTSNMIATTLSTSGIVNCEVLAAAPFEVSGTGALTGILMAYETAVGTTLSAEKKEIATQELVTTTKVANNIGQVDATEIINAAKMQIIEGNVIDHQEVSNIVNNVVNNMGVTLSESDYQMIVDLLTKIADQEYDYSEMKTTLQRVEANMETMAAQQAENEKALAEAAAKQAQQEAELAAAAAKQKEQELALAQAAEQQSALEAELAAAKQAQQEAEAAAAAQQAAAEAAAAEAAAAKEAADKAAAEAAATAAAEAEAAGQTAESIPEDSILVNTDDAALDGAITDSTFEDDVVVATPEDAEALEGDDSGIEITVSDDTNVPEAAPAAEQPASEQPAAEQPAEGSGDGSQVDLGVIDIMGGDYGDTQQTAEPAAETPEPAPAVETPEAAPVEETPEPAPAAETPEAAPVEETPEEAPVEEPVDVWTEGDAQDPAVIEGDPAAEEAVIAEEEPAAADPILATDLRFLPNLTSGAVAAGSDELVIYVPYAGCKAGTGTITVNDINGMPYDTISASSTDHVKVTDLTAEEAALYNWTEGSKMVITMNFGLGADTTYYVTLTDGVIVSADDTRSNEAVTDQEMWSFDTSAYGIQFARTNGAVFHNGETVNVTVLLNGAANAHLDYADGILGFSQADFTQDAPAATVTMNGSGEAAFTLSFYDAEGNIIDMAEGTITVLP